VIGNWYVGSRQIDHVAVKIEKLAGVCRQASLFGGMYQSQEGDNRNNTTNKK